MGTNKRLLTVSEVAECMRISPRTVRRMAERGDFPGAFKAGRRAWRIPREEVEEFVERQRQERQAGASTKTGK